MYWYLRHTGRRLHVNKSIAIGAAVYAAMLVSFVAANKLTTAANAIVLQFTEPIWVIFLGALIFRNRPRASALVTALVMIGGIALFFLDGIMGAWGNVLAIVSGVTYAGVFLIKKMDDSDYECSAILGFLVCFAIGLPLYPSQPALELSGWVAVVALGVVQLGLGALFLVARARPHWPGDRFAHLDDRADLEPGVRRGVRGRDDWPARRWALPSSFAPRRPTTCTRRRYALPLAHETCGTATHPKFPARESWHCHTSHVRRAGIVALPHIPRPPREKSGTATHPTFAAREERHCHTSGATPFCLGLRSNR